MKYIVKNDNGEVVASSDDYNEILNRVGTIYVKCDKCGQYEYADRASCVNTYGNRTEWWCEDCTDIYAFYCSGCNRYYDRNYEDHTIVGDEYYCEYCRDSDLYWCEECGEYYTENEGEWCEEENEWLCYDCLARRTSQIRGYHSRPPMRYYNDVNIFEMDGTNFKGFGIELEIDRNGSDRELEKQAVEHLNEKLGDHVYFNRDGSLNYGFEIISQPHTREALMNLPWEDTLKGLVRLGYRSHDVRTCGLHMHVSRELFGENEEERTENIAKTIYFYETFWSDILKFSRRTAEQADIWASRYCGAKPTIDETRKVAKGYYGRYYAVNLTNSKTIEFRLMRGTLNYKTFMATLDFLMTIAENSKKVTEIDNLSQWLDGIKPETKLYMASRNCFGYSNNQETIEQGDEE